MREGTICIRGKEISDDQLYYDITRVLTALCFKQKYSGYSYVREAVRFAVRQERFGGISKCIYPVIAKELGISSAAVESGMRTAIHKAWVLTDVEMKRELFGTYGTTAEWVPSNSEFVYMMADRLSYPSGFNKILHS